MLWIIAWSLKMLGVYLKKKQYLKEITVREGLKLTGMQKIKNIFIKIFTAIQNLLVWSFAIIFYLMNSVNVRLYSWTNLRFYTLFCSLNGIICFALAAIVLLI